MKLNKMARGAPDAREPRHLEPAGNCSCRKTSGKLKEEIKKLKIKIPVL